MFVINKWFGKKFGVVDAAKEDKSVYSDQLHARRIAPAGMLFSACFVYFGYHFLPIRVPQGDLDLGKKLAFTLRWQILEVMTLLFGVLAVGNIRFLTRAINPLIGAEGPIIKINLQYLQNTLEQLVLAVVVQFCLTTWLDSSTLKVIPLWCILFLIGRISFFIGYHVHYMYRAFGFTTTIGPTLFACIYCLWSLLMYSGVNEP